MPTVHGRSIASGLAAVLLLVAMGGCSSESALEAWSDDEVVAEFERLHRPILDLYSLSPEDAEKLWALLGASFAGEALTTEFVEQLVTVAGMRRDRTRIHVASVDYESVQVVERVRGSVRVEADWSVGGLVSHRAHTHPRINRYRASYALEPAAGAVGELRFTSAEIRSLERQRRLSDLGTARSSASGSLGVGDLLTSGLAEELLSAAAEEAAEETAEESTPPMR